MKSVLVLMAASIGLIGAPASATDFGIRTLTATLRRDAPAIAQPAAAMATAGHISLAAAAALGAGWGRVTSTLRSAAHNRAVGGVPNSWHLRGRAIDIARRAGVTHSMIAAAFRSAGFHLIESLDEGDHSHFAFAAISSAGVRSSPQSEARLITEATRWGIIVAPGAHGR